MRSRRGRAMAVLAVASVAFLQAATLPAGVQGQIVQKAPPRRDRTLYVEGQRIETMVVFGDSVSDTGNFYQKSFGQWPVEPFYNGHFCNGPMWPEYAASDTGSLLINYATGAAVATSKNIPAYKAALARDFSTLDGQIDSFLSSQYSMRVADATTLHIVFMSINDYLGVLADHYRVLDDAKANPLQPIRALTPLDPDAETAQVVADIVRGMRTLYAKGARSFVVVGFPAINDVPYRKEIAKEYSQEEADEVFEAFINLVNIHNQKLLPAVQDLARALPAGRFKFVNLVGDPAVQKGKDSFPVQGELCLSIDYVTGPYGDYELCSNPDDHYYWDDLHPTTKAHKLYSDVLLSQTNTTSRSGIVSVYTNTALGSAPIVAVGSVEQLAANYS